MSPPEWTPPLATYVPVEEQAEEDLEWMKVALDQVSFVAVVPRMLPIRCRPCLLYYDKRFHRITMLMGLYLSSLYLQYT